MELDDFQNQTHAPITKKRSNIKQRINGFYVNKHRRENTHKKKSKKKRIVSSFLEMLSPVTALETSGTSLIPTKCRLRKESFTMIVFFNEIVTAAVVCS